MDPDKVAQLRDHYDNTDVADHFASARLDTRTTNEVLVSTSIRLSQAVLDQVRAQAGALGIPATALMRQWVTEAASATGAPKVVSVAELQRFIAEQARPLAS